MYFDALSLHRKEFGAPGNPFRPGFGRSEGVAAHSLHGILRPTPACDTKNTFKFVPKGQAWISCRVAEGRAL